MREFDVHESGQLRLTVPGEQTSLLPLPDSLIPSLRDAQPLDNPEGSHVHSGQCHDPQAATLSL